jgi:hypothetical protein
VVAFIGLDRGIVDHWIYQDAEYFKVWFEMLYRARFSHEPEKKLIEGKLVTIEYGQFIFGRMSWSERLNISEQRLRTLLKKLTDDDMIEVVQKFNKFSLYYIKNYAKFNQQGNQQKTHEYQGFESDANQHNNQQLTSSQPAANQQLTTQEQCINNVNKVNKDKTKTYTPEFDEFWNVYPRKIGKMECFKTWEKVIKKGEQSSFIIQCADNYAKDCLNKQTEERFIKHPKTFLNDERYKDFKIIALGGGSSEINRGRTENPYAGVDFGF